MNKIPKVALWSLFMCYGLPVNAGQALMDIDAAVQRKAAQIDQSHGVLLTTQERINLKIALVVEHLERTQPDLSVKQKAQLAITLYEIVDPTEQRQLVIELEAQQSNLTGNGGGDDP